jgi:hypothetical protein
MENKISFEHLKQLLTQYVESSTDKRKAVQDINHVSFMLQHEIGELNNEPTLSNTSGI